MAPKKIGPCRGAFPRWHYNGASQKCEGFVFGGCRENLNNYLSKDECTNACSGTGMFNFSSNYAFIVWGLFDISQGLFFFFFVDMMPLST